MMALAIRLELANRAYLMPGSQAGHLLLSPSLHVNRTATELALV